MRLISMCTQLVTHEFELEFNESLMCTREEYSCKLVEGISNISQKEGND
jgi:hypothetical protein